MPYFGFKAKLSYPPPHMLANCTVPYFGFKAKQERQPARDGMIVLCLILDSRQNKCASGLMAQGIAPPLAAQFQTDFCQSSFNGAGETKLCVQNMAPVAEVIPSILR